MESGSLVAAEALRAQGRRLRPLCRNFARGFCRWGPSCRFSHDRKPAHVCRYFQSGFCSYGERCSYEHIQEQPVPAGTRYGPAPPTLPTRWGLEPGRVAAAVAQGRGGARRSLAHPVPSVMHVAAKFASMGVEEEEKDKENIPAPDNVPLEAAGGEFIPARARGASGSQTGGLGLDQNCSDRRGAAVETATGTDRAEVPVEPGVSAAPVPAAVLRARSEAVVCGICMDRVYEKPVPGERLFGILPNCSHAFCVGCIRKWRRSRDFQSAVVKACPECRVTSGYYIPHKYWVSDVSEKEKLIETFKARMGKIRCKFFVRNSGYCPFKSDCIYLHELPAGQLPRRRRPRPRMPIEFSFSSSESSDEDDEICVLEWALHVPGTDLWYMGYGPELLFATISDSD